MTVGWRRGTFPSARRPTRRVVFAIVGVIVFAIVIAEVAADVVSSGAARVVSRLRPTSPRSSPSSTSRRRFPRRCTWYATAPPLWTGGPSRRISAASSREPRRTWPNWDRWVFRRQPPGPRNCSGPRSRPGPSPQGRSPGPSRSRSGRRPFLRARPVRPVADRSARPFRLRLCRRVPGPRSSLSRWAWSSSSVTGTTAASCPRCHAPVVGAVSRPRDG